MAANFGNKSLGAEAYYYAHGQKFTIAVAGLPVRTYAYFLLFGQLKQTAMGTMKPKPEAWTILMSAMLAKRMSDDR